MNQAQEKENLAVPLFLLVLNGNNNYTTIMSTKNGFDKLGINEKEV